MKRSEAIGLIEDAYINNSLGDGYLSEYMADKILTALEQAGMLPPNRGGADHISENDNTWEPENET